MGRRRRRESAWSRQGQLVVLEAYHIISHRAWESSERATVCRPCFLFSKLELGRGCGVSTRSSGTVTTNYSPWAANTTTGIIFGSRSSITESSYETKTKTDRQEEDIRPKEKKKKKKMCEVHFLKCATCGKRWEAHRKLASCEAPLDAGARCPESLVMYVGVARRPEKGECEGCKGVRELWESLEEE